MIVKVQQLYKLKELKVTYTLKKSVDKVQSKPYIVDFQLIKIKK
ncbi:conserved hypothetical protein [Carnobacterium maltaromaticum]|nr:conserved hypothetical protein [Carnobacterium maltaromaticum]